MSQIRVGVIGYGYWGPNIVRNLYALGTGGPDVGAGALDLPALVAPETLVTPRAVIANYRGAPQRAFIVPALICAACSPSAAMRIL